MSGGEKAEKAAGAPRKQAGGAKADNNNKEVDPWLYLEGRQQMLARLKEKGVNPYPHKFETSMRVAGFVEKYSPLQPGQSEEKTTVSLAGRLLRVAGSGSTLRFYDLMENGSKVQILANFCHFEKGDDKEAFLQQHDILRRGDIVGVVGFPGRTDRGELSIFCKSIQLLSTCFHMLPKSVTGLKDQEVRYRQRYLDLLINPQAKTTFEIRSRVISHIRKYLLDREFIEVETPMMTLVPGGASARPFITHHNELDMNLYLRIATELHLKMLIVGGMDRVFEIGKNFRNEGIDLTHNPEFTAVEFYQAYADYHDMKRMTEEIISSMALSIHGSYKLKYHPDGPEGREVEIDFTPPYPCVSFVEEIEKRSGKTLPRPLDGDECVEFMKNILREQKAEMPHPPTAGKLLDKLCGVFIEDTIVHPTFITDHPQILSPLAKWHRSKPELTERCELFILGKEVSNFYTELNDPAVQRQCFKDQAKAKAAGDDEACDIDEGFCTALDYGLPPTGGWGLGVDRVVMFMADKNNIKEVILFPAMRNNNNPNPTKGSGSSSTAADARKEPAVAAAAPPTARGTAPSS